MSVLFYISYVVITCVYTGCLKRKYSCLIYDNFITNKAIKLEKLSLDRGKTNLNFNILQCHFTENIAQILMFKFGCIFLDVCKICKNRCIKYQSGFAQLKQALY